VTRLAEGVYAIEHQDNGDGFASENTMVVIGSRQVLVVDAGFLPSDAKEDIAQIRRWTDKPVAFLLNTHFHNDHNFGNRAYLEAFPGITIVAQEETKLDMDRFGPGSAARVERGRARLEAMAASGRTQAGKVLTSEEMGQVRQALTHRGAVLDEMRGVEFQSATMTFARGVSIDLGGRVVELKFLGRGNTAGDAVAWLPRDRIVATGDLLVYPLPYAYDGYPSEWATTLGNLAELKPAILVPGHGPVERDTTFLTLTRELFQAAVAGLNAQLAKTGPALSSKVEDVKTGVDLSRFRARFGGRDPELLAAFDDMAESLIELAFTEARLR
jgi:glyoxylase-like metal-dependent hydrolase (beta-lactamase superfamily II)